MLMIFKDFFRRSIFWSLDCSGLQLPHVINSYYSFTSAASRRRYIRLLSYKSLARVDGSPCWIWQRFYAGYPLSGLGTGASLWLCECVNHKTAHYTVHMTYDIFSSYFSIKHQGSLLNVNFAFSVLCSCFMSLCVGERKGFYVSEPRLAQTCLIQ